MTPATAPPRATPANLGVVRAMTSEPSNQEEVAFEPPTAEEAVARLEDVQRVTETTLAYLDLDDLLEELLKRVTDILQADTAAVLLVEDDGRTLAARAAKGLEEEVERGFRLPVGRGFAGRVAATREPVVIPDLDNSSITVVNPLMREKRVRSLAGVPLIVEGTVIGVLHVGSLTQRDFTDADVSCSSWWPIAWGCPSSGPGSPCRAGSLRRFSEAFCLAACRACPA